MKEPTQEEFNQLYKKRRQKAVDYLTENQIGAAVFIDSEAHREPAIRYLTGHTGDAVLIIFENGKNVLIPWDEILARKQAFCDKLIPYTKYKNSELQAVQANLNAAKGIRNMKVELPPYITYPDFLSFIDALPQWDVRCKQTGIHKYIVEQRMIKDEYEIACT